MALSERLAILITANPENAVKGFEKVGKAAEKNLGKAEQGSKKFGSTLTKVGAGMAAFGGVALVGLAKLAEESEKDTLATLKLQNSLKNNPHIVDKSTKAYEDLADAIQSHTSVANEDVVAGEAVLAQMGLTADQIKSLTPLVTDLAVKFGKTMPDAAKAVGKAVNGSAGALGRYGIVLDKTALKTDSYKTVQDGLSKSVGGFADEQGKTFTGSLQRMKNELQDLEEGVGKGAVTAFTNMFSVVNKASVSLSGLSDSTQSAVGEIATYGSVAAVAVGGTSVLIGQVIKAKANFSAAAESVALFSTHLKNEIAFAREDAAAIGGLGVALKALQGIGFISAIVGIGAAFASISFKTKAAKDSTKSFATEAKQAGDTLDQHLNKRLMELRAASSSQTQQALQKAGVSISDLADAASGGQDSLNKLTTQILIANDKTTTDAIPGLESLVANLHTVSDAYDGAATAANRHAQAEGPHSTALSKAGIAARMAGESFTGMNKQLAASDFHATGIQDFAHGVDVLGDNLDDAQSHFSDFNDQVDRYLGKTFSVQEATDTLQQSFNDMGGAVKDAGGHFTGSSDAAIAFRKSQEDIVSQTGDVLKAMGENGASADDVKNKQNALAQQYLDTAKKNHVPLAVALLYAQAIRNIPTDAYTTIHVDTTDALAKLNTLITKFNQVPGTGQVHGVNVAQFIHANASGHATGGDLDEGWNIVGERGPEPVFKQGSKAHVFTNAQGRAMAGGGGNTYSPTFIINGAISTQATVAAIARHEKALAGTGATP